jgi:LacI family transcriptional regulator
MLMKRHVALLIETSSQYGREVIMGIVRFMRTHDDWSVYLEQREIIDGPPAWLSNWHGDGILSRVTTPKLMTEIARTGIPLVNLTDREDFQFPAAVTSDHHEIGRLAAEHLLERGFRHFGFCGYENEAWSRKRGDAFAETVGAAGFQCENHQSIWLGSGVRDWEKDQLDVVTWLRTLPRPIGILACNDFRGQAVVDACSKESLAVPEVVAVIGVDNDEMVCSLSDPPLSSVIPNAESIGFQSAQLLSELMNGLPGRESPVVIAPIGVATRQSTDVIAIEDAEIAQSLQYIRKHACSGMNVSDITDNIPVSRSTLERSFRKLLGRSPQQEIRHVQVKRAQELIHVSDLSIEQISAMCGFSHPEYMQVVFKRIVGMTPGQYRAQVKI